MLPVYVDKTLSYPVQFQTEAVRNRADHIDSSISPNSGGTLIDFSKIEANSLQDTVVSFSVPTIPAIPPKLQADNDPYKYAATLQAWKKTGAKVNALVASVRTSIKPSLDKLRSLHVHEVVGTDIPGCTDTAAA